MNNTKKRFNIIDFVILVIILGCIAGLVIRYNIVDSIVGMTESEVKTVSFIAKDLYPEVAASVKEGSVFYCEANGISLGSLSHLKNQPGEYIYIDSAGSAASVDAPVKRDISGSFELEGFVSENGFMINGTQYVAPGKEMLIQSEDVQISVIITEIK